MTNLVLILASVALHTNRIESLDPSGEFKTITEVVTQITTFTNSVVLHTNKTDFIQVEVNLPYPPGFMGSKKKTKVWKPLPKLLVRPPRDLLKLNIRDKK